MLDVFPEATAAPLNNRIPVDWDKDVPIVDDRTADDFWERHPSELTDLMERLPDAYQGNLARHASTEAGAAQPLSVKQIKAALIRPEPPPPPTAFLNAGKVAERMQGRLTSKVAAWLDGEADKAFDYVRKLDRHFDRLDQRERIHTSHGMTLETAVGMLEPLTHHDPDILPMLAFTEREIGKKARELADINAMRGQLTARREGATATPVNFLDPDDLLIALLEIGKSVSAMLSIGKRNIIPEVGYATFPYADAIEWISDVRTTSPATNEEAERAKRESPKYWRRNLRRRIARAESHVAAILRMAGRQSPFVSSFALTGWRSMQERTSKWMDRKELENSVAGTIERLSLAEISKHGKEARRSQLVAMVKGLEEYGKDKGYRGVFLSPTLPPEWHPNPSVGGNSYNPHLSPSMANRELSERWHRVMSAAHEADLKFFGVATKEAHLDGCPHMHAFLWGRPEDVDELVRHARRHFPGEHACKVKLYDDEAGTAKATTYVLTYVLKTLGDGVNAAKTDDGNAEADRRDDGGDRHSAWASRNGIRRFSFVGLPKGLIGKWKAIHRTLRAEDHPADLDPTFRTVRRAMAKGQWKRALILLGAFSDGDRLTVRHEERTDCWGGTYRAAAAVVNPRTGNEILLRPVRWTLVDKKDEAETGLSIVASTPRVDDLPVWEPLTEGLPPCPYWDEKEDG
ncbi:MAG: replication endonuclease [Alphaproteobacteria bacterium]|nr:replication endonuclease [Alphaproteobacteria bacterium]